jgi:hypothetical protein
LYLCTHLKEPTIDDQRKPDRVFGYLRLTRKKKRIIRCNNEFLRRIIAYVDAAFTVHVDGKSHT